MQRRGAGTFRLNFVELKNESSSLFCHHLLHKPQDRNRPTTTENKLMIKQKEIRLVSLRPFMVYQHKIQIFVHQYTIFEFPRLSS